MAALAIGNSEFATFLINLFPSMIALKKKFYLPTGSGKTSNTFLIHNDSPNDSLLMYEWEYELQDDELVAIQDFEEVVEVAGNYQVEIEFVATYTDPPDTVNAHASLQQYSTLLDSFGQEVGNIIIIDETSFSQFVTDAGGGEPMDIFTSNVRAGDIVTFGGEFRPDLEQPTNQGQRFVIKKVGWPWLEVEQLLGHPLESSTYFEHRNGRH